MNDYDWGLNSWQLDFPKELFKLKVKYLDNIQLVYS